MPLVAAAVVPHAPVLVQAIAASHANTTIATRSAIEELGQRLLAAQVQVMIIITPHGASVDERMTIVSGENMRPDLRTFGDVSAYPAWPGSPALAQRIRSIADEEHVPVALHTSDTLDYGTSVPLLSGSWSQKMAIVPIAIDHLSREMIIRVAHVLHEAIHQTPLRVACIASADLEERTTSHESPDRPTAWERSVATAIRTGRPEELPADDGRSCGYSPIAVLLSMLDAVPVRGDILSFQSPFRIGYIVADLHLNR